MVVPRSVLDRVPLNVWNVALPAWAWFHQQALLIKPPVCCSLLQAGRAAHRHELHEMLLKASWLWETDESSVRAGSVLPGLSVAHHELTELLPIKDLVESKVLNVGHHVLDKNFCNPKKTQDTVLGLFSLNLRALLSTSRPVEWINSCFPAELLLQKTWQ